MCRIAKKLFVVLTVMVFVFSVIPQGILAEEKEKNDVDLAEQARSAILMEMDTGKVLFKKNPHEKLPPASMTKMMTMLLIMEAIERDEITYEDQVRTSEYAASMGGSQIFLEPGEKMSVRDMLKAIAVASANDASVAMAEAIAGSEKAFVKQMNEKAKEIGLKNTHFSNSNGLPAENHYSSAHDLAMIARELLKYEKVTTFTKIYQDYLREDSKEPFWLVNTNRLVRFYDGVDGLKTGYTSEAKFCLTATAKRENMRVIAVVMGEPSSKLRNREVTEMLDYAFTHYKSRPIYKQGEVVEKVKVDKGLEENVNVVTPHQVSVLLKKGEKADDYKNEVHVKSLVSAPVEKGEELGYVAVTKDGKEVSRVELIAQKAVDKAGFWKLMKRTTRKLLFDFQ